jgi:thiol-disulfide isomerase/thioredoxin
VKATSRWKESSILSYGKLIDFIRVLNKGNMMDGYENSGMAYRLHACDAEQLQTFICLAEEYDVVISLLNRDSLFLEINEKMFYWFWLETTEQGGRFENH